MNLPTLTEITLRQIKPASVPELLSAARSEFLNNEASYDGRFMTKITALLDRVGISVYNSDFKWSEYNKGQWEKFVQCRVGLEGGACMFSFEANGDLPEELDSRFKGLGLGVPVGMFPYSLWISSTTVAADLLRRVLEQEGYSPTAV